jgi:hypothetical protein
MHSKFTDAGLRQLSNLPRLYELNLRDTKTSDAALSTFATMNGLRRLNLRGTTVTAEGVRQLLSSPTLNIVEADSAKVPQSLVLQFRNRPLPPVNA